MAQPDILDPKAIVHKLCEKIGDFASAEVTQHPPKAEIVTKPTGAKPPLHALIIGINKYKDNVHLAAAVPDAVAFKEYLANELLVPENQIKILLDEEATRSAIIAAFQELAKQDNGIERGDPIVIYYAGHGSEINPPPDRAENGSLVQCIIPQDTSKADQVVPIPDFTIGTLVHRIAREKGNNITLIFDCCHSATGTRDTPENARFVNKANLPELPASPDKDIIHDALSGSRDIVDPASLGFSFEGMDSHVLLAACGHGEVAFENGAEGHGYFSAALLQLLRSVKVESLTYKGCMQRLPPLRTRQPQNPVCEGRHMNRLFFDAKVPGANTSFIAIKPNKSNEFYLQAGLAQGITPGSLFEIHETDIPGPTNRSLGKLEVDKVDPFVSHLKDANLLDLPPLAYGRQVGYGSEQALNIYVTQEFVDAAEPSDAWARAFSGGVGQLVLRPVDPELASVILSVDTNNKATFTLRHQASVEYGVQTLPAPGYAPVPSTAPYVIPVLTACSQWSWNLRRMPDSRPFKDKIDLEFYKLRPTGEYDEGNPIFEPDGQNINVDGVVDVVASDTDFYGMKVSNRSTQDLYCYLFSFSCTSLSIDEVDVPVLGASSSDPTLPKNQPLTIGYGAGGIVPFMFQIDEGRDIDVSVIKCFVSNQPADFQSLKQESPFEGRGMVADSKRRYPKGEEPGQPPDDTTTKPAANLFTGRSTDPLSVQARSAAPTSMAWFRTPILTKELLDSIHCMRLRTFAKQQGPAGATATEQTGGYFEISVIGSDDLPKLISPDSETTMTYRSHSVQTTDDYEWTEGVVFEKDHEIWGKLEVGDCFEVSVCARGRGWKNEAEQGELIFW
ncbi:hypothetical protein OPQ81_011211 [Rhizoctonia solani]|nr:hypothetical protein OPQ81_011211 [Rhizoctonia solani]